MRPAQPGAQGLAHNDLESNDIRSADSGPRHSRARAIPAAKPALNPETNYLRELQPDEPAADPRLATQQEARSPRSRQACGTDSWKHLFRLFDHLVGLRENVRR